MIKKAGHLFTAAYLLLIFGVYPLYMKEGYVDIGKAKYQFFICCSLASVGILIWIAALWRIQLWIHRDRTQKPLMTFADSLSSSDLFVMLYGTELVLSCVLSDYRQEALRGTEGWYMGLTLLLTLCTLYFLVSRLWDGRSLVWYVGMTGAFVVFVLGILDRFSLYLIPLKIRQSDFISTLGNINWFCGYLSVLAPVGICLFMFQEKSSSAGDASAPLSRLRWIAGLIYTIIAFMAGFCQGSDSVFLLWGALFFILLWIAVRKRQWISDLLLLFFLWCLSALGVRLLYLLFPEGYNYETKNLCLSLARSNFILFAALPALAGYLYLRGKVSLCQPGLHRKKMIHKMMVILLLAGFLLWAGLSLLNTWFGIPFLSGNSLFLLDLSWGNGRGATFCAGYRLFRQMPPLKKLFGVGPDCFAAFAYSLPEIAAELNDSFAGSRLTNAHNELLTSLVNTGLPGTCFYYGILISFITRCLKKGAENRYLYAAAVCVFCCLIHNMVSFAQVLNLPFVFLIMGMGECILRKTGKDSREPDSPA